MALETCCLLEAVVKAPGQSQVMIGMTSGLEYQKAFAMLFLMLGPFKVLVPFVELTGSLERREQVRMATVGVAMAALMLVIAGVLGKTILDNFDISIPVLALTGGLVLFLMALDTVLHDRKPASATPAPSLGSAQRKAVNPLAFPIIVTPYGLAAVIVFFALSQGNPEATTLVATVIAVTLAIDWIAMLYARPILALFGTALQIIAIVLSVVQTALGLQIIVRSLELMGMLGGTPG